MRKMRIVVGVLIFVMSIAVLVWGLKPLGKITHTQTISPEDLQLPTPVSLLIQPIITL